MRQHSGRAPLAALFVVWAGLTPIASSLALAKDAPDIHPDRLAERVASAFESGDAASLGRLFPTDLPVRASLERIADMRGYVGAGSVVEALRRYLGSRTEVRFEAQTAQEDPEGSIRIRGTLSSRCSTGRREKVRLHLTFEKDGGRWRAVEIRETG